MYLKHAYLSYLFCFLFFHAGLEDEAEAIASAVQQQQATLDWAVTFGGLPDAATRQFQEEISQQLEQGREKVLYYYSCGECVLIFAQK